ncbi:MAG: DUF6498-containing protein [Phycisphaerae bacterium]|nr:DUF6498-containing protein [Phycisphaerae bacterium]
MLSTQQITQFQKNLTNLPLISLLIANALPIVGVLCFGWDAFAIVLLYWTENIVLGFYNVLKMVFVKMPIPAANIGKLFMIPFFIIHYGGFTAVHGMFVLSFFTGNAEGPSPFSPGNTWPCFLVFVQLLFNVIRVALSMLPPNMLFAVAGLFVSHGVSFGYNYFYKGERRRTNLGKLMSQPYGRIVVLHIAILFGGFLTMAMGSPVGVLLILVLLKTVIDVKLHLRERQKNKTSTDFTD